MKRLILFVALFPTLLLSATDTYAQPGESEFSRGNSYAIRPELFGAVAMEFGYQFNPQVQASLGIGFEFGDGLVCPEPLLGVRAYASDTKWTFFFDYHIGLLLIKSYAFPTHRFTVGPSYKNFDFGGGIGYTKVDGVGVWGPCLNIGYNFRIRSKR